MVDFTGKNGEVFAPERVSSMIAANVAEKSIISQLAGTSRVITGDGLRGLSGGLPVAHIVEEGALKPSSDAIQQKTVGTAKAAVISVVSEELLEDDDALMEELQNVLPVSLARKIDQHILSEESTHIDTLGQAPEVTGANVFAGLTAGITSVQSAGYNTDSVVVSPEFDGQILSTVDSNGRPLYLPSFSDGVGTSFLGRKLVTTSSLNEGAVVGDFSTSSFATIGGVKLKVSDQATIDGVSLFQQNLVAILAEIRFSFITPDNNAFARVVVDDVVDDVEGAE